MRMGDGDGGDTAQCLDRLDNGFVQQRNTVPQDVGLGRANKQGSLTDGEVRIDTDADQARLLGFYAVSVRQAQAIEYGPVLAGDFDVLPFILADDAFGGRLAALGVLRAT